MTIVPRRLSTVLALVAASAIIATCTPPPPQLTPQAQQAFYKTRALKALDLLRDTIVDGNAQTPPLFSESTLVKVTTYHQSVVKIMVASDAGWKSAVLTGLDELLKDLPSKERAQAAPYVSLIKAILQEVHP